MVAAVAEERTALQGTESEDFGKLVVERKPEKDRATGWIRKLTAQAPELAEVTEALTGSRGKMMDTVRELGLPFVPYAYATVEEFLRDPQALAGQLKGDTFFCTLQPTNYVAGIECPSLGVISVDELVEKIKHYTEEELGTSFTIMLSEVRDVAFLGNIVINSNNQIYGEFTDQGIPPTRSGVTRLFGFRKDDVLDTFRYDFKDAELREAIYRSVSLLPHTGTGRDRVWDKGYYELNLTRGENGGLSPAFYDYRQKDAFLFVPIATSSAV